MAITEIRMEGLRTLDKICLRLDGLTVLIGDNGSGKSTIIEALELLRRAAMPHFLDDFYVIHGGLSALLRQGAARLTLGVTLDVSPAERVDDLRNIHQIAYDLSLIPSGSFAMIEETIRVKPMDQDTASVQIRATKPKNRRKTTRKHESEWVIWVKRFGGRAQIAGDSDTELSEAEPIDEQKLFLAQVDPKALYADGRGYFAGQKVKNHLKAIQVHLPFEVMPSWGARALDRKSALRSSMPLAPAMHLDKLGLNLANAFHALKNNDGQQQWQMTLDYIRLGLGEHIEDVSTWADPSGGNIGLSVKFKGLDRQIPASQLADGMLAYLAFVALFRLQPTVPSLMAFDEPDLHLHPELLMRVLDMFETMAHDFPVVVATHSDRLLDGLSDPAQAVVLCDLTDHGATRLVRPDREALEKWLERYRGLGDVRATGHAASVLTKVEPRASVFISRSSRVSSTP